MSTTVINTFNRVSQGEEMQSIAMRFEPSPNYRYDLEPFIGKKITLRANEFYFRDALNNGEPCIIMTVEHPETIGVPEGMEDVPLPNPDYLWITIDQDWAKKSGFTKLGDYENIIIHGEPYVYRSNDYRNIGVKVISTELTERDEPILGVIQNNISGKRRNTRDSFTLASLPPADYYLAALEPFIGSPVTLECRDFTVYEGFQGFSLQKCCFCKLWNAEIDGERSDKNVPALKVMLDADWIEKSGYTPKDKQYDSIRLRGYPYYAENKEGQKVIRFQVVATRLMGPDPDIYKPLPPKPVEKGLEHNKVLEPFLLAGMTIMCNQYKVTEGTIRGHNFVRIQMNDPRVTGISGKDGSDVPELRPFSININQDLIDSEFIRAGKSPLTIEGYPYKKKTNGKSFIGFRARKVLVDAMER